MIRQIQSTQIRLARHYLNKLRSANAAYKRGSESTSHGLRQFEQEWPHIKQWQGWAAERIEDDQTTAELVSAYSEAGSDLLELRLPPNERIQWLELALTAAQQTLDWPRALKHLGALCRAHTGMADYTLAGECAKQGLTLARLLRDDTRAAEMLHQLGAVTIKSGDYAVARDYLEQSIGLWRSLGGGTAGMAHALHDMGMLSRSAGDYVSAQQYYQESLAMYRVLGSQQGIAYNLHDLGLVAYRDGDYTVARAYLEQSLAILLTLGDQSQIPYNRIDLGLVLAEQSEFNAAYRYIHDSLENMREQGNQEGVAYALENLGHCALLQGDDETATDFLNLALQIYRTIRNPRGVAACHRKFATIALRHDDVRKARAALREALDIAARIHSDRLKIDVVVGVIELYVHTGQIYTAAEMSGMVMIHPATMYTDREIIQSLWPQMEAELGADSLIAIHAGCVNLALEDVVLSVWQMIVSGKFYPLAK